MNQHAFDYFDRVTSDTFSKAPAQEPNNPSNISLVDYFNRITSKDPPKDDPKPRPPETPLPP